MRPRSRHGIELQYRQRDVPMNVTRRIAEPPRRTPNSTTPPFMRKICRPFHEITRRNSNARWHATRVAGRAAARSAVAMVALAAIAHTALAADATPIGRDASIRGFDPYVAANDPPTTRGGLCDDDSAAKSDSAAPSRDALFGDGTKAPAR